MLEEGENHVKTGIHRVVYNLRNWMEGTRLLILKKEQLNIAFLYEYNGQYKYLKRQFGVLGNGPYSVLFQSGFHRLYIFEFEKPQGFLLF
jgi:hypothetical protein